MDKDEMDILLSKINDVHACPYGASVGGLFNV